MFESFIKFSSVRVTFKLLLQYFVVQTVALASYALPVMDMSNTAADSAITSKEHHVHMKKVDCAVAAELVQPGR